MNRYLKDRAMRRDMNMRDGRNPYGSRGGYVSSRRGRGRDRSDMNYDMVRGNRGYDRGMDYEYDYPKHDSQYDSRYDREYGGQDGHYPMERHGEHYRPMDYEIYGVGGMRPLMNDYRGRRMDYGYGYDYASEDMEKEWKEDLEEWCKKLKKHDRFNFPKEQILSQAKQMGVKFDEFTEEEFLTVFYMVMSDYPQVANEPHTYLAMAKDWLMDKDSELQGSEKLSAYYYEIINAGQKD